MLEKLHQQARGKGKVFWIDDNHLAVFDADKAYHLDRENFADAATPGRFLDLFKSLSADNSTKWQDVRSKTIAQAHTLNTYEHLKPLYHRMMAEAVAAKNVEQDLTIAVQRIVTRPMLKAVVHDLTNQEFELFLRDQDLRFSKVIGRFKKSSSKRAQAYSFLLEHKIGRVARNIIKDRLAGRRPDGQDFTAAILSMYEVLGLSRAAYALSTITTAITGAPGPVAASLICELTTREKWRNIIVSELEDVSVDEICAEPKRHGPQTLCFIKEVLRYWGFPALAHRRVRKNHTVSGEELVPGKSYTLCMYSMHRDEDYWEDPYAFNPDRWREGQVSNKQLHAFTPFGWGERKCIGASIGLSQLVLLCHMFATKLTVSLPNNRRPKTSYHGPVAFPDDFIGSISVK